MYCSQLQVMVSFDPLTGIQASRWYVSVVFIIFDCSIPILYNFHILLATFYTIFGTNILIQCPVPVPVCCMFFVSQKIHMKQSRNGTKTDGDFLEYMWFLGRRINERRCPRGPRGRGHAPRGRARPRPSWPPHKAVGALLSLQERQYPDKNHVFIIYLLEDEHELSLGILDTSPTYL